MAHQCTIPRLPPEIERLIFEAAASQSSADYRYLRGLLLIAHRVHTWIQPYLWRVHTVQCTLEYELDHYPPLGTCRTIEDIGAHIHHLHILITTELEIARILKACPNVQNLALWVGNAAEANLSLLKCCSRKNPLLRLSADLQFIPAVELTDPMFSSLTHLEIIQPNASSTDQWSVITALPKLTHVSLRSFNETIGLRKILRSWTSLQLILLVLTQDEDEDVRWSIIEDMQPDPEGDSADDGWDDYRLVLIEEYSNSTQSEDWFNGAHGGFDSWSFGELISDLRSHKRMKDNGQRWISREFGFVSELTDEGLRWLSERMYQDEFMTRLTMI